MAHSMLVLDEVVSRMAHHTVQREDGIKTVPLINADTGEPEGMLVDSLLERVAIFVRAQDSLSLADISALRRTLARAQARRAYLYVLMTTSIQKPVMLLATLSKIRIVRVEAPGFAP